MCFSSYEPKRKNICGLWLHKMTIATSFNNCSIVCHFRTLYCIRQLYFYFFTFGYCSPCNTSCRRNRSEFETSFCHNMGVMCRSAPSSQNTLCEARRRRYRGRVWSRRQRQNDLLFLPCERPHGRCPLLHYYHHHNQSLLSVHNTPATTTVNRHKHSLYFHLNLHCHYYLQISSIIDTTSPTHRYKLLSKTFSID